VAGNLQEVRRWELANGGWHEDVFPQIAEKRHVRMVGVFKQVFVNKITPLEHGPIQGRPLAENNRTAVGGSKRERVPLQDVARQNVRERVHGVFRQFHPERLCVAGDNNLQQPFATFGDVIDKEIDTVQTAHGENGVALPALAVSSIVLVDHAELSAQHFGEKVPVAAGRF